MSINRRSSMHISRKLNRIKRLSLLVGLLIVISVSALFRSTARPDRGVMPVGAYSVSDIENINLTNGNVNLNIPLASLPPVAGGKLSWTINASYNSKVWDQITEEELITGVPPIHNPVRRLQAAVSSWAIGQMYRIDVIDAHSDYNYQPPNPPDPERGFPGDPDYQYLTDHPAWYKVVLTMPDGSTHEL